MLGQDADLQEVAFYYPGHLWSEPEWIKTLLLFFDGIGLLVPEYKQHEPESIDPVLAGPLRDRKLLHYLVADEVVDAEATAKLASSLSELLTLGAFDKIAMDGTTFHAISMSRLGYYGDQRLAQELYDAFESRGLARPSEDGKSIPIHPLVRSLVLTLLAQILCAKGSSFGFDLSPATDRHEVVRALAEFLNIPQLPSSGHVIAFDLQTVAVDLSTVPIDEVLSFREENGKAYRKYVRSARTFARHLSLLPSEERTKAFRDRSEELDDLAADLRQKSKKAWKRPATFSLGLAGGFWSAVTNPIGGALSLAGLFVRGHEKASNEAGAFSYLFEAQNRWSTRSRAAVTPSR
jgi:hypothetical protein